MMPRRARPLALLALVSLVVAACGGGESPGTATAGGLTKVKVGILPIADVAPIWYGMDKGLFAAEGLEIETVTAQGGAAIMPSVNTGDYQFGFGNVVSLFLGRQKGLNMKIVSNLVNGAEKPDRFTNALMVKPGKGITSVKDMAGRKFAVTTLQNAAEVTIKATLEKEGVDVSGVQFAEYAFPTMNAMVERGDVDVAWQAEPFVTLGRDAGLVPIADPMYGTEPNLTIASMFASEDWLSSNGETAAKFKRALGKAIDAARADEPGIRATIGARTQTPPPVVPRIALANWRSEVNRGSLENQAALALEYKILSEPADVGALLWSP
jgi:NitT/TauT family transport system substrate-binding protein